MLGGTLRICVSCRGDLSFRYLITQRNCKTALQVAANTELYLRSFSICTLLLKKNCTSQELAFEVLHHIVLAVHFLFCNMQPFQCKRVALVSSNCYFHLVLSGHWQMSHLRLANLHLDFSKTKKEFVINCKSSVLCIG